MDGSQILFYAGIALMAIGALGAVISFFALRSSKKRLNAQLEKEYGARRR